MPRFVILEHDHPTLHWDFLLETGEVLRAWRLAELPASGRAIAAQANVDHRVFYLDYEGEVSGGRGRVTAWERGEYQIRVESEARLELHLEGRRLRGAVVLEQQAGDAWLFQAVFDAG